MRYYHCRSRSAFTLLELMLAISMLAVGLTAVVSTYLLALDWSSQVRIDLTALQAGRIAIADATLLTDEDDNMLSFRNDDELAQGWLNNYYIIRTCNPSDVELLPNNGGKYITVRVKIYYGGDEEDGRLVHHLIGRQILANGY